MTSGRRPAVRGAITRRRFVQGVLAGGALGAACDGNGPAGWLSGGGRRAPNLVVLVTDDQRADSVGFAGNPIVRTPNLDALAAESTVFDHAFVTTSVCACSRASLFTGQYMRRHGVHHFGEPLSPTALAASYPVQLRSAGYWTAFLGKWGLGGRMPSDAFDVFEGFSGQGEYEQTTADGPRHLTRLLAERTAGLVSQAPTDRPFCISVSFKAPHGPWWGHPPDLAELYAGQDVPLPPTARAEAFERLPAFLRESMGSRAGGRWLADPAVLREALRDYYRLVTAVDEAIAVIRTGLADAGLEGDTVLAFTSDNGIMIGEHGLAGKWLMFEESIRVPMLIHDPRAPRAARGRRVDAMVLNIDLAPTLLDLAGVPIPELVQGRSLAPWVRGETPEPRRDWFYEHDLKPGFGYVPVMEGVREVDWKYVRYLDERSDAESLYDLRADPRETRDLAGDPAHAAELERLRARWRVLRDDVS